jgi:hypothetical protein
MLEFRAGRPGNAAALLDSAVAGMTDPVAFLQGVQNLATPIVLLAGGGGRVASGRKLADMLFAVLPFDSAPGDGGLMMTKPEIRRLMDGYMSSEAGLPDVRDYAREIRQMLEQRAGRDSARLRQLVTAFGTTSLSGYLATRDTTLLVGFLALADTSGSATWRVGDAHLALARGDSARARMRVDRHFRNPEATEFTGEPGIMRAFAWGDLLARLGEHPLALQAYAVLDTSSARIQHPGFLVRSWAARGAVHEALGETARAIEQYERFLVAWEGADAELQPEVERVREKVGGLRGD